MSQCAIATCSNHYRKTKSQNIMYHGFPKDPVLQKIRVKTCRRRDGQFNVKNARLCSNHFVAEDYVRNLKNELLGLPVRHVLKEDAVPTQCLSESKTKVTISSDGSPPPPPPPASAVDAQRASEQAVTAARVTSRERRHAARSVRKRCLETLHSLPPPLSKGSMHDKQTDTDGLCDPQAAKMQHEIDTLKCRLVQAIRAKNAEIALVRKTCSMRISEVKLKATGVRREKPRVDGDAPVQSVHR